MNEFLKIDMHDDLFKGRIEADEWERILAFRSRPHFLKGVNRHAGLMTPFFSQNFILSKVVVEAWRFQMIVCTLYLHTTRDVDNPRSGLTLANLQRVCSQLNLASPGRVFAFLNIMKLGGFLSSSRSKQDSRIVHFEPTPHFLSVVEEWNSGIFASVDAVIPEENLLALSVLHTSLGEGMRTCGAQRILTGWQPLESFPEVMHFAATDGGWMLMETVIAQCLQDPGGCRIKPVNYNLHKIAPILGGSRSNFRRLLEEAYTQGLLEEAPKGGANIILSTLMICSFLTFMASYLSNYRDQTYRALDKINAGAAHWVDV